jgi:hypothetical protein
MINEVLGVKNAIVGMVLFDFDTSDLAIPLFELLLALDCVPRPQGCLMAPENHGGSVVNANGPTDVFIFGRGAPFGVGKTARIT